MALIKRDSKPSNPESIIMIKLFEKLSMNKASEKFFDRIRILLRERLNEIKEQGERRGTLLDSEILEGAKPALQLLNAAYREIDKEEKS